MCIERKEDYVQNDAMQKLLIYEHPIGERKPVKLSEEGCDMILLVPPGYKTNCTVLNLRKAKLVSYWSLTSNDLSHRTMQRNLFQDIPEKDEWL